MKLPKPQMLHDTARQKLDAADQAPKKLVLVHTGAVLLVSLLLSVISYILRRQIDSTVGLGGLQDRAVLETAMHVLQVLQIALLPFWQYGYICAVIDQYRGKPLSANTLLGGFHRFGPILRITLIQGAIYAFIAMAASYAASYIFVLTPWGADMMDQMMGVMSGLSTGADYAAMEEMLLQMSGEYLLPLMGITGVILAAVAIPVWYRYRLAPYLLMENQNMGAIPALHISKSLMRRNRRSLFMVDLHFWWFYALELLLSVVCYGDLLLELAGVTLPWPSEVSYFVFLLLYAAGQLGLYYWKKNEIELTYMAAYDSLLPKQE